ncbi:MAG: PEP-CTERM sorting domain-containing protein [Pirellulales bacterium]
MKKSLVCSSWVLLALVLTCSVASAGMDVKQGDLIKLSDGDGDHGGGAFNVDVKPYGTPLASEFQTFCVENGVNQFVSFNTEYRVDKIDDRASTADANTGRGVLTSVAAWVYSAFRDGSLNKQVKDQSNNDVTANATQVANALQNLVWGQLKYYTTGAASPPSMTVVENNLLTSWIGNTNVNATSGFGGQYVSSGFAGLGNVRIMQLVDSNGGTAQDQLTLIPEPASIAVWSMLGLGLLGAWRRRRIG